MSLFGVNIYPLKMFYLKWIDIFFPEMHKILKLISSEQLFVMCATPCVCVSLGRSGRSTDRLLSSYIPLCTSKYMVDFYLKFVNCSFIFIKVISFFKNVFKYFIRIVILISYAVSKKLCYYWKCWSRSNSYFRVLFCLSFSPCLFL